jgi:hypothetical protein
VQRLKGYRRSAAAGSSIAFYAYNIISVLLGASMRALRALQVCNGKSQEGEPLLLALLETLRDVRAGEELTFDYKPSSKPWKGPGKPQGLLECKCGAHNCR